MSLNVAKILWACHSEAAVHAGAIITVYLSRNQLVLARYEDLSGKSSKTTEIKDLHVKTLLFTYECSGTPSARKF